MLKESLTQSIENEPSSEAAVEAKKLGLSYGGFGRYMDRTGEVKYIVVNKKLVPFTPLGDDAPKKPKPAAPKKKADGTPAVQLSPEEEEKKEMRKQEGAFRRMEIEANKVKREHKKEAIQTHVKLMQMYKPEYFNQDEIDALHSYAASDFAHLNRYLFRGFDPTTDVTTAQNIVAEIETLDAAFQNAGAPFDYTMYTGLSPRYDYRKMKNGVDYTFRGYVSGSLDTQVASEAFTSGGPWVDEPDLVANMLEIDIKTGQKSIYMSALGIDENDMETMLPRGTKVRIMSGPNIIDGNMVSQYGPQKMAVFKCEIVEE